MKDNGSPENGDKLHNWGEPGVHFKRLTDPNVAFERGVRQLAEQGICLQDARQRTLLRLLDDARKAPFNGFVFSTLREIGNKEWGPYFESKLRDTSRE